MNKSIFIVFFLVTLIASCDSKKSLQEYLVEKENSSKFISASLPASLLFQNLDSLSPKQEKSLNKIEKINLLALTKNKGESILEMEHANLNSILNQPDYESLLNFKGGGKEAKLLYVGTESEIDELIFFGFDAKLGLMLLRMRGDEIEASDIYQITQSAQRMDVNIITSGFGDLIGKLGE